MQSYVMIIKISVIYIHEYIIKYICMNSFNIYLHKVFLVLQTVQYKNNYNMQIYYLYIKCDRVGLFIQTQMLYVVNQILY